MYLSKLNSGNIFVADPKNDEIVLNKKTKFTLVLVLVFNICAFAQESITIRPGDVNNDGIVNNYDALFLAEAFGSQGPARENTSSDFYNEQTLPVDSLWGESFYNGLNFAYADCNGDGIVNEADFYEGIVGNFFEDINGFPFLPNPNYLPGNPRLAFDGDFNIVPGEDRINLELLVEADDPIEEFMGFIFTLEYDKADIEGIEFLPFNNSWLGESQNILSYFIETEAFQNSRAQTHIALILKNDLASGVGGVGQISIVMEEIVLGLNSEVTVNTGSDVLVGVHVQEYLSDGMDPIIINPTQQPTSTQDVAWKSDLKAYPNPVGNQLNIQLDNPNIDIQNIEVLNANGQRLYEEQINYQSGALIQLDWSKYASGLYFLKITTSEGIEVRRLTK
ncbi:MAG: T9SS type A sorting domain-containing protein [Saprospiraceae bacterium]|nr:T9SS type A sorting domain-containing protein [Saprospiraceae bacterium]